MSHFFTKDKREQLALLNQYIDLTGSAPTAGQVLKAVADGDGNIKFAPGLDDTATGLPSGSEDEILRIVSGTAQFVDISGELLPAPSTAGQVLTVISNPDPDGGPDVLSWQSSSLPSAPTSIGDLVDPAGLAEGSILTVSGGSWTTTLAPNELPPAADGEFLSYRADLNSWEPAQPNMLEALRQATPARMNGDVLKVQSAVSLSLGVTQADDMAGSMLFNIGFSDETEWQAYGKDVHIRFRVDADQGGVFVGVDEMTDKAIVTIYAKFDGTDTIADIKAQLDDPSFLISGLTINPLMADTTPVSGGDIGGGAGWTGEASSNNIIYAYGSTVWNIAQPESLPEGSLDGDTLIWKGLNRTSSFDFVGSISIGGLSIGWVDESQWLAQNKPISLTFVMDPDGAVAGGSPVSVVHNTGDQLDWSLTANWNQGAGGIGAAEIENVLATAIANDPNLNNYIQINGSDSSISSSDIGLPETMGSITAGPSAPFILFGRAYWESRPPATTATNMLTDNQGIMVIDEGMLVMGSTYDLNLVGHEMIVVLNDWATKTGEIDLRLKNGTTGQQVFIKNLSNAEQFASGGSANRVIKVKAGDGGTGSGKLDLESGVGFVIDPMVDMHLVCINGDGGMSGDGEWIIL
tara:strand:- start:6193 stop:8094 length:1902 start_codon:yes stop_codon:yes gene_type:complete